jgi:hypothetical protein
MFLKDQDQEEEEGSGHARGYLLKPVHRCCLR